ncbi:MAG: amidase [Pseudomonadota bacterium]|nr:amidase [Pseudomonadota bacterium]
MANEKSDVLINYANIWLDNFQNIKLDKEILIDPARIAGEIGQKMRELSHNLSFDRQPLNFLEKLESFSPIIKEPQKVILPPPSSAAIDYGAITKLSLTEVVAAISEGKLTSEQTTRACLDRIKTVGRSLNCIAGIDVEAAINAARKIDNRISKGEKIGPLAGVPLAHKDMFYRKNRTTECGSRIRKGFIPEFTSSVLKKLDQSGALDIARLNMVEFAIGVTGHNEITGPVRNPWNLDYISGGSSSGSGAAVAAGLVFGALGSDTGGSIRFPASCCGLVGLKPTLGRVSRYGSMPLSYSLDTIGPLTRTVTDNAFIFQIIAGKDKYDPASSNLKTPDVLSNIEDGVKGLKLGIPKNYFLDSLDEEVSKLINDAIKIFQELGAEIKLVTVPESISAANGLTSLITATEGATIHNAWLSNQSKEYGHQTLGRLLAGAFTPATTYLDALQFRLIVLEEFMEAVFNSADVLLSPVMMTSVPTITESDLSANPGFSKYIVKMGHATRPINYLGLPGLSIPCGFTNNGLPSAFQLIGRPFDEGTLYKTARAYELKTDCTSHNPII